MSLYDKNIYIKYYFTYHILSYVIIIFTYV